MKSGTPDKSQLNLRVGHWGHLFGLGSETLCRIVLDTASGTLVAAQLQQDQRWRDLTADEAANLRDSIINANQADQDPESFGLVPVTPSAVLDLNSPSLYCWVRTQGLFDGLRPSRSPLGDTEGAKLFYEELMDAAESFGAIVEVHGQRTMADLFYLQNAILSGTGFDLWPNESQVLEVVRNLPSADRWASYMIPQERRIEAVQHIPANSLREVIVRNREDGLERRVGQLNADLDRMLVLVNSHEFDAARMLADDMSRSLAATNRAANALADVEP